MLLILLIIIICFFYYYVLLLWLSSVVIYYYYLSYIVYYYYYTTTQFYIGGGRLCCLLAWRREEPCTTLYVESVTIWLCMIQAGRWASGQGQHNILHSFRNNYNIQRRLGLPQHHVHIEGYDSACKCHGEYTKTSRRFGSVHKHGRYRAGECERWEK